MPICRQHCTALCAHTLPGFRLSCRLGHNRVPSRETVAVFLVHARRWQPGRPPGHLASTVALPIGSPSPMVALASVTSHSSGLTAPGCLAGVGHLPGIGRPAFAFDRFFTPPEPANAPPCRLVQVELPSKPPKSTKNTAQPIEIASGPGGQGRVVQKAP